MRGQRSTPLQLDAGRAWLELEKPILAMIRGYCIGGGLLTALQADIRVCSEDSQFGVPLRGSAWGTASAASTSSCSSWGRRGPVRSCSRRADSTAPEALQVGLVNRVVTVDALRDEVWMLAGAIRDNAPLTVRALKVAIREARRDPAKRDLDRVASLVEACFRSEDYREGQAAFMEKRPPAFRGR